MLNPPWLPAVLGIITGALFILRAPKKEWARLYCAYLVALFAFATAVLGFPDRFTVQAMQWTAGIPVAAALVIWFVDFISTLAIDPYLRHRDQSHGRRLPPYLRDIADAVVLMAGKKIGALIVIERKTELRPYLRSHGLAFDSEIRSEILRSIFVTSSPVHDGAVIVRRGRIAAVKALLPLATRTSVPMGLGTRHRSAIGITERTDCVVIVCSEERGETSVVFQGEIHKAADLKELHSLLYRAVGGKLKPKVVIQEELIPA